MGSGASVPLSHARTAIGQGAPAPTSSALRRERVGSGGHSRGDSDDGSVDGDLDSAAQAGWQLDDRPDTAGPVGFA